MEHSRGKKLRVQKPGREKQHTTSCSLVWREKDFENEWGEMRVVPCLLPLSWLCSSSCPFPGDGLISLPYFSSLHSCDLLGAKDAREKVASPWWLTYRIADAGTPRKTWSHVLFQDIQPYTADPAAAVCSLPIKGTFAWKEVILFTLFPRQICPAESRLGEWARGHRDVLPTGPW